MKTGRNSVCHCGSGLKYKQCCGPKEGSGKSSVVLIIGAVLICGAVVLAFFARNSNQLPSNAIPVGSGAPAAQGQTGTPGAPQPPGPAPEGKVWSVEHGHWHDASGQTAQPAGALPTAGQGTAQGTQPTQPGSPQPPGPAPAGKVWSVEHGHWHDAK